MIEPAEKDSEEEALAFGGFSEDRLRIDRIVERLDVADDLVERADLGSELVRAVSRYEDTFERTLRPRLEGSESDLETLDEDREALREAMDDIHERTMGIDPRNVHASDGQGFEDTLTTAKKKTRGKRTDQQCKKMIIEIIEENNWHTKQGFFDHWYNAVKKEIGM